MRSASAAFQTDLDALGSLDLALGVRIARLDGTILRSYEGPDTLTIDLGEGWGSESYLGSIGMVRSAHKMAGGMQADSMDVEGFFDALGVTEQAVRAGKFDGATVWVFSVLWSNAAAADVKLARYDIDEVDSLAGFSASLVSLIERFNRRFVGTLDVWCPFVFMDTRCGITEAPAAWAALTAYALDDPRDASIRSEVTHSSEPDRVFYVKEGGGGTSGASAPTFNNTLGGETTDATVTWITAPARSIAGTVSATITSRSDFIVTVTTDALDDEYALLRYTSGANIDQVRRIESYTASTGRVTLDRGLPFDPVAAETVTLVKRCNKIIDDAAMGCKAWANTERHGGAALLSGDKKALALTAR